MPHTLTEIDPDSRTAVCAECGPVHIRGKNDGRRPDYIGWRCSPGSPKEAKAVYARRSQRVALYESQRGACAICGVGLDSPTDGRVDHCHESGVVRGLLCPPCNIGLGHFRDSVEALRGAIRYLLKTR